MKVHVVYSVLGVSPRSIRLTSERASDVKQLRIGPWVKERLLLFDMGYFSYSLFERVGRNGGFFITSLKDNANPKILFSHRAHRGRCKPIEAQKLRSVLSRMKKKVIDVQIEAVVRRRAYNDERSKVLKTFRLVGVMNEETGEHHLYVTNVPPEKLDAEDVARTYAARWGVEMLFKQLKSHYRIHELPSQKRNVMEALVYAAILTLVISRALLFAIRKRLKISMKRTPEQRWAAVFQSAALPLLQMLVTKPARGLAAMWEKLEKFLAHEILDPNRHRTLRLNYGKA
jgi:IS4 transposase